MSRTGKSLSSLNLLCLAPSQLPPRLTRMIQLPRIPRRGTLSLLFVLAVFFLVVQTRSPTTKQRPRVVSSSEWSNNPPSPPPDDLHYHDHDQTQDELDLLILHPPPRSRQPEIVIPPTPRDMNGYLPLFPRSSFPTTKILLPVAGFNLFDRLYLKNGVVYIVVEDKRVPSIPELKTLFSKSLLPTPENVKERLPTDKEIRIINADEAPGILGTHAMIIDGFTVSRPEASKGREEGRKVRSSRELKQSKLTSLFSFLPSCDGRV